MSEARLAVAIDPTRATAGAAQVNKALDDIKTRAAGAASGVAGIASPEITNAFQKCREDINRLTEAMKVTETVGLKMWIGIGAAVLVALGATVKMTQHTSATLGLFKGMSEQAGVTVEKMNALAYASEANAIGQDVMAAGLKKLNTEIANARAGIGDAGAVFAAAGVTLTDVTGKVKSADQVFLEMSDAFKGWRDDANKSRIAAETFGTGLISVASNGRKELERLMEEGQALRNVTLQNAEAGAAWAAEWNRLTTMLQGVVMAVGNVLLPILTSLLSVMLDIAGPAAKAFVFSMDLVHDAMTLLWSSGQRVLITLKAMWQMMTSLPTADNAKKIADEYVAAWNRIDEARDNAIKRRHGMVEDKDTRPAAPEVPDFRRAKAALEEWLQTQQQSAQRSLGIAKAEGSVQEAMITAAVALKARKESEGVEMTLALKRKETADVRRILDAEMATLEQYHTKGLALPFQSADQRAKFEEEYKGRKLKIQDDIRKNDIDAQRTEVELGKAGSLARRAEQEATGKALIQLWSDYYKTLEGMRLRDLDGDIKVAQAKANAVEADPGAGAMEREAARIAAIEAGRARELAVEGLTAKEREAININADAAIMSVRGKTQEEIANKMIAIWTGHYNLLEQMRQGDLQDEISTANARVSTLQVGNAGAIEVAEARVKAVEAARERALAAEGLSEAGKKAIVEQAEADIKELRGKAQEETARNLLQIWTDYYKSTAQMRQQDLNDDVALARAKEEAIDASLGSFQQRAQARLEVLQKSRTAELGNENLTEKQKEAIRLRYDALEARENARSQDGFLQGWRETLNRYTEQNDVMFNLAQDMARQTASGMANAFNDLFFAAMNGQIRSLSDVFLRFAQLAQQIAAQVLATLATTKIMQFLGMAAGAAGGAAAGAAGAGAAAAGGAAGSSALTPTVSSMPVQIARGGVMTDHGLLPMHTYDKGGITSSPQVAIYGEGRGAEAYVPLPDGRSIPVTMQDRRQTQPMGNLVTVSAPITIITPDASGVRKSAVQIEAEMSSRLQRAAKRNT